MTHTPTAAQQPHHHHHGRPGHGPAPTDDAGLAHHLDLDGVLSAQVRATALDAASAALGTAPARIVDLGAGTGTGSLALAQRFDQARIHSLDASAPMLDRLTEAARATGVDDRIDTHLVDLDGDWPAVLPGGVDLAWAALSLHHVTDPDLVLRQTFTALRPGGVLVVTEFTGTMAFEPADLGTGRDDLGDRLVGVLAANGYPMTAEWTTALGSAGFAPVERTESVVTASAHTPEGARYLALPLRLNHDLFVDSLPADDIVALDAALAALEAGTSSVALTSPRAVWIAVRPGGAAL